MTYLPVGAQRRDGGRPAVTAGGTSIALADTDSDGFGARGRCACVFSAVRMLILTALTTGVVAAADGLRCAGASDGRVTVTGSYPSGQSNLDVTTCRPSATLRCAALVLLFPTK